MRPDFQGPFSSSWFWGSRGSQYPHFEGIGSPGSPGSPRTMNWNKALYNAPLPLIFLCSRRRWTRRWCKRRWCTRRRSTRRWCTRRRWGWLNFPLLLTTCCKRCRTKCPGSETAVKMVPSRCEKTLENYFREKISPWTRVGRGGFCLRRQICIDCGQPLVHRRYVAVATVFGTHTQAVRSCSYNALKTLVHSG